MPSDIYDLLWKTTEFEVTADHLKLLRRAYVGWDDCEFGAPAIDCKRPYGNSDVIGDIAEILAVPADQWKDGNEEPLPDAEAAFARLHRETALALQIALTTGEFKSGRYTREKYGDWKRAEV